ncbi:N-acetyltransferase [Kitasatospora xanthocidica]|uniref:GNAT family N-acetyltransferase n=1 Tax=Kitasatospora xanthocidica TaxID=83382 RepID=UPI00167882B0|nr:GNAT family N-acetyltransferase [Kitasatospora xanthocidica]GHF33423.1 N-acetyltransferase [Kitasatospora xanthocidica]
MVTLRTLTTADWPLWRDLRLAALTDAPYAFTYGLAEWHDGGEERWRARLHLPGAHHVAAFLDDVPGTAPATPVGLVGGVLGSPEGVRELRSLWVAPRARGRGVADRLIEEVEHWARAGGGTTLHLGVLPGNTAALVLYRRHGFTPLTPTEADAGEGTEAVAGAGGREIRLSKPLR